jgi:MFS transporter, DHA2 family, multidrug resistance protein
MPAAAVSSGLQRISDAYTLVFASLLLTVGSLSDRYGRRRTLLAGLAIFGGFSAAASPRRAGCPAGA